MKANHLSYGMIQHLLIIQASDEAFPDNLYKGLEVALFKSDEAHIYMMRAGEEVIQIKGATNSDEQILTDICTRNSPRVSWIVELKPKKNVKSLYIQNHTFPTEFHLPLIELAVDEKTVESSKKLNHTVKTTLDVIGWLTDQCLLESMSQGQYFRAFISAGAGGARKNPKAFMLHGKSIRVHMKRIEEREKNGEILVVDRITRGKANDGRYPIMLAQGTISFCDKTLVGKMRYDAQSQLSSLISSGESFLNIWHKYGELEADNIIRNARAFGKIEYDSYELQHDGSICFSLRETSNMKQKIDKLSVGDVLEAGDAVPAIILNSSMTWAEYDDISRNERADKTVYIGEIRDQIIPESGSITIKALDSGDQSENMPSPDGFIYLSILGDQFRLKRRRDAEEAIRTAKCPMPHLGLLLEGKDIPYARHKEHKAITKKVKNKVFASHPPTQRQEKAIQVALNTPDVALIQGPPGTGKTTVITAIIERLNEIADNTNSMTGQFLISGFQHDAVENALSKIDINGLPPVKFGKKLNRDGFEEAQIRIERWRKEKIRSIREKFGGTVKPSGRDKLRDLVQGYLLAPGTLQQTVELLDRVLSIVAGQVNAKLLDELADLKHDLESDIKENAVSDEDKAEIIRSVRALRTSKIAFLDDGAQNARRLYHKLRRARMLNENISVLLNEAANWTESKCPPFLDKLAGLRRELLIKLIPKETPGLLPVARKDTISVLVRIRKAFEAKHREAKNAPELVVSEFLNEIEHNPSAVCESVIDYTSVYGATCQQSARYDIAQIKGQDEIEYDSVIVDEAARANPLDLFIPIRQAKRRIILVGDHRQLPHIIDTQLERALESSFSNASEPAVDITNRVIHESLFERLFVDMKEREKKDGIPRTVTLDEQYRMPRVLGKFVSEQFYEIHGESEIKTGLDDSEFIHNLPGLSGKVAAWLDVPKSKGKEIRGMSKSRPSEAKATASLLKKLIDSPEAELISFGIISFYSAQIELISRELEKTGMMIENESGGFNISDKYRDLQTDTGKSIDRLRVGTVDAFQGRQFDVVILSMVRSNELSDETEKGRQKKYGHLMLPNRLCVSMSRQKRLLIVVGDSAMLEFPNAEKAIGPLVNFHKICESDNGCIL